MQNYGFNMTNANGFSKKANYKYTSKQKKFFLKKSTFPDFKYETRAKVCFE